MKGVFILLTFFYLCLSQQFAGKNTPVSTPLRIIYVDYLNVDYNDPTQTVLQAVSAGFNVIILAFYLSASGPTDMALTWEGVPAASKQAAMNAVHAAGAVVLVSFGGGTDIPYSVDPTTAGTEVAQFAVNNYLDGVDFDLENLGVGFVVNSLTGAQTVSWIATATNAARSVLGNGGYISHAPQGPYFGAIGSTTTWAGATGGYSGVYAQAPSIDFFNVQFYNQGATCYVDYNGLFVTSCTNFPGTSVEEIVASGVPLSKIVVGKIVTTADGGSGFVDAGTLNTILTEGQQAFGWNTGVMGWKWQTNSVVQQWISTIYPAAAAATIPVVQSITASPAPAPTTAPVPTTASPAPVPTTATPAPAPTPTPTTAAPTPTPTPVTPVTPVTPNPVIVNNNVASPVVTNNGTPPAVIGGVVGGVIGGVLIIAAVVAFIIVRRRREQSGFTSTQKSVELASNPSSSSSYPSPPVSVNVAPQSNPSYNPSYNPNSTPSYSPNYNPPPIPRRLPNGPSGRNILDNPPIPTRGFAPSGPTPPPGRPGRIPAPVRGSAPPLRPTPPSRFPPSRAPIGQGTGF